MSVNQFFSRFVRYIIHDNCFTYRYLESSQPVEMLRLLVYAAAECGAQHFVEMLFTSSAGRVVFDAYKDKPVLPEVIAKNHGNEKTANYLEDVTKRYIFRKKNINLPYKLLNCPRKR